MLRVSNYEGCMYINISCTYEKERSYGNTLCKVCWFIIEYQVCVIDSDYIYQGLITSTIGPTYQYVDRVSSAGRQLAYIFFHLNFKVSFNLFH